MSFNRNRHAVDCMNTNCKYNSSRTCGYSGRLVIDADGSCEMAEDSFGRDRFP